MSVITIIKAIVVIGFLVWLVHMSNMLFVDLQEQKKSTSQAVKLWLKALAITFAVIGVIIY